MVLPKRLLAIDHKKVSQIEDWETFYTNSNFELKQYYLTMLNL
jgi:hypothetical protein